MDEKDRFHAIKYLELQMDNGYIDICNHSGDEGAFEVISEALELYKEKYKVE